MSTRYQRSDFDDVDDATYRMLDSRFCRVTLHGQRHEPLRHRRGTERPEPARPGYRSRRMREPVVDE